MFSTSVFSSPRQSEVRILEVKGARTEGQIEDAYSIRMKLGQEGRIKGRIIREGS